MDDLSDRDFMIKDNRENCVGEKIENIILDYKYEINILKSITDT